MRTQVGIVGAGPAGLTLGRLLEQAGIESVILESRSRAYVEHRIRAGVLEQRTVDLLNGAGVGERMAREGIVHHGVELQFDGERHRIPLSDLTGGRTIVIYGQTEVVKDLIAARLATGSPLLFEVDHVAVADLDSDRPAISFTHGGVSQELECDVVAGCDGFHGICRDVIPPGVLRYFDKEYPFGWLGVLAAVAPSSEELIYASNDRGFALHSMRSPEVSRFYLQVAPKEDIAEWSDERIWEELRARLETVSGWTLSTGPVLEKGITAMRSFVTEPMQFGRLFLAGDAAHIVPPTGAKGLNLAAFDVTVLTRALSAWYGSGDASLLDGYSQACLHRVWRAQHFSWWMTTLLHTFDHYDAYDRRLQESYLDYVCSSVAASTTLAENYVGLDMPDH